MSYAVCIYHLSGIHLAISNFIQIKLQCPTEMLKNLPLFVSYCYFHYDPYFKATLR